jgi:TonB family protein
MILLMTVIIGLLAAQDLSSMEVSKTYSPNKKYYLEIIPKGCNNNDSICCGKFYALDNRYNYQLKWTHNLLNAIAPSRVILSDSGEYVVTLNEWTADTNGDHILVIYGPGGELIKNLSLDDIIKSDKIKEMLSSNKRKWWVDKLYSINDKDVLEIQSVDKSVDMKTGVVVTRIVAITLKNGDIQPQVRTIQTAQYMPDPADYIVLDIPDKAIKLGRPRYPELARRLEQQGSVYVKMLLDLDGTVMNVLVIKSSGFPQLDSEAVEAAYKSIFSPAQVQGKPVRVWVAMPIRFELE